MRACARGARARGRAGAGVRGRAGACVRARARACERASRRGLPQKENRKGILSIPLHPNSGVSIECVVKTRNSIDTLEGIQGYR